MGPSGRGCSTSPHPSYHSEWKNVNTVTEYNQTSLILYDTSVVLWWCCQWVKFNTELGIKPINPLSPALYTLKVDMDKKISLKIMGVKTKYLNLTCVRVTIIQVLCVNLMLCRIKTHHRMNFLLKTSIQKRGFALLTLICDDKNFSLTDRPEESKCEVVDSSALVRQKARDRSGGRPLIDTSRPLVLCVHTLNAPTPVPPILPASLLHGAPWLSCISMVYERWRGGNEGLGEVQRQRRQRGRIGQCSEA